jgi:hypothetical protein
MPHDPSRKLTPTEIQVYGPDAKIHPVTGEVCEMGSGALPIDQQALIVHCAEVERREGKIVADELRRKLQMPVERRSKSK